MSILYVIATPLGNRSDITIRAKELLQTVEFIFAEDTRMVKKLLALYEITTTAKIISYHSHSSEGKSDQLILLLQNEATTAALVTDAGTPAISDPGAHLISLIYNQVPTCSIIPVPGASAVTSLVSVAGLPTHQFVFLGFVPHKKGRQTFLNQVADSTLSVVFYESPHRIMKTLEFLDTVCPEKTMIIGREMTKQFEEYPRGTVHSLYHYYQAHPDKVRGEFACIVS